jgi:Brp/Blh family beta-carotene 15,15'-monooxygenase
VVKYSNISIVISFFGLWLDSFFSNQIQIILGFTLIFSFGILHGSNDLLLIENKKTKKNTFIFFKKLTLYVLIIFLSAILFYFMPLFALLLFIIVSAFHFGEQQWKELISFYPNWICNSISFAYGLFILLLLFIFHTSEVENNHSDQVRIKNLQNYHLKMSILLSKVLFYRDNKLINSTFIRSSSARF